MAKAAKPKATAKPNKKDQYERFQKTARELGVDDEGSAETFERAFEKIVPVRPKPTAGPAHPNGKKASS
jgi:hypothetical protein